MNWKQVDQYHIKSGPWTISKPGTPANYPKPYHLYLGKQSIGFYATADEAKAHAEYLEVTQA